VSERSKPALLYVLAALVLLEGAALAAACVYLVIEIFVGAASILTTAIAYAVTAAIVTVLVVVVARSVFRGRPWTRGAVVCIAVLQLLVAYSILITKEPLLGWVLVVPAVLMLVLQFTRPVLRATARPAGTSAQDDRDSRTF
jgi:hypothetical protein